MYNLQLSSLVRGCGLDGRPPELCRAQRSRAGAEGLLLHQRQTRVTAGRQHTASQPRTRIHKGFASLQSWVKSGLLLVACGHRRTARLFTVCVQTQTGCLERQRVSESRRWPVVLIPPLLPAQGAAPGEGNHFFPHFWQDCTPDLYSVLSQHTRSTVRW